MEPKILEDLRKFVKVPTRATDFRIRPSRCRYSSDAHPVRAPMAQQRPPIWLWSVPVTPPLPEFSDKTYTHAA